MGISGNYFKYNGISSKQMYGLMIANMKTSYTDNPIEGEKKYITAKLPHEKKFRILGQTVENPYSFDIEFFTEQVITPAMHREIMKWLFDRPTFCKLEIINYDYNDTYYNCIIQKANDFVSGNHYGVGTHGYKATVMCDASWAWENKKTNTYSHFLDALHIIGTRDGSSVSFDTTYQAKLDLSMDGNSSQTIVPAGNNLFSPQGMLTGINGADIFAFNTGKISIQGSTVTSDFTVRFTPNLISGEATSNDTVFLPLISGQKYTFSVTNFGSVSLNQDMIIDVNSHTTVLSTSTLIANSTQFNSVTFTSDGSGITSIDIKIKNGTYLGAATDLGFQLEKGEVATKWEQPHPCSPSPSYPSDIDNVNNPMINIISPIGGNSYTTLVKLCKLSDSIFDTYNIISGVKTQIINNMTLTGTENITIYDNTKTNTIQFSLPVSNIAKDLLIRSNRFTNQIYANKDIEDNTIIMDDNQILIRINKSFLSTVDVDGFKTWLISNSTNILYQQSSATFVQSTAKSIFSEIGTNTITTNSTLSPTLHLSWYSDVPTFNFINSSDDIDISYPEITILVGTKGGTVGIKNIDDNYNIVQFTGTVPNEIITMDEYGQVKSSTGNSKYNSWNKHRFVLVGGNNHITSIGDVASLDVTYQNVRRCGID